MHMNALQGLHLLIEEAQEIDAQASKLQAAGPLYPGTPHAVREFQRQYFAWYTSAMRLLPIDLQERFAQERFGPEGDCGQIHFATKPTITGPDRWQVYDALNNQIFAQAKLQYTYPYERCFHGPLLRQVRILIEATHRPDLVSHRSLDEQRTPTTIDLQALHARVVDAVDTLFENGHYRLAILEACTTLADAVREKPGCLERDDTPLMQRAFSSKKPILKASEDEGEQQGVMSLFVGAVMGLRNPGAHRRGNITSLDAVQAFEWLAFASALMRIVDQSERMDAPTTPTGHLES